MDEIRTTDDNELCGHVDQRNDRWLALTVFGSLFGEHDDRGSAVEQVLAEGPAKFTVSLFVGGIWSAGSDCGGRARLKSG